MITSVLLIFLVGCGNPAEVAVKKLFSPSPDKDVTADPYYNFSPFTNTVWKTKTKTAIGEAKIYTGAYQFRLLPPSCFDPTESNYIKIPDINSIAVMIPNTRLRITRLLKDQGAWGGYQVEAVVEGGTNTPKAVYLDKDFLTNVWWASKGPTTNTNWGVNPDLLTPFGEPVSSSQEISDAPQAGYKKGYINGKTRAILANTALPQNKQAAVKSLSDPWSGLEFRPVAVMIYGEDYVAEYESGYRKGFHDHFTEK